MNTLWNFLIKAKVAQKMFRPIFLSKFYAKFFRFIDFEGYYIINESDWIFGLLVFKNSEKGFSSWYSFKIINLVKVDAKNSLLMFVVDIYFSNFELLIFASRNVIIKNHIMWIIFIWALKHRALLKFLHSFWKTLILP